MNALYQMLQRVVIAALLFSSPSFLNAQCPNTNVYYTDINTEFDGDISTVSCVFGGEYLSASVCSGVTYIISTCNSSWDTQITLYSENGSYLAYDDDGCNGISGGSYLSWTANFTGVIRILINQWNCQSNTSCVAVTMEQIGSCNTPSSGCPNDNVLYDVLATPSGVGNTVNINGMYAGEYVNVNVCQGASYTFSTCSANYDTQLTLYSSTGTLLAHNDDYCGFQSQITWTAPFSGTVRLLLDAYINSANPCGSNTTYTPVTITQNTACSSSCTINSVTANVVGCDSDDTQVNFVVNYTGSCTVEGIWLMVAGGTWQFFAFSGTYISGQTIPVYFSTPEAVHSYYFQLSNGATSSTQLFTTLDCTNGPCPNDNVLYDVNATPSQVGVPLTIPNMFAGEYLNVSVCQGASYTFSTCAASYDTKLTLYSPLGTLLDYNDDYCGLQSQITWTATYTGIVRVLLDQYTSTNYCASNSTATPISITQNTACPNTCNVTSVNHQLMGCVGGEQLVNFIVNFSGACSVATFHFNSGSGWQTVPLIGTIISGEIIGKLFDLSNTTYQYYFTLSNGTQTNIGTFTTGNCAPAGCTNLSIQHVDTGCENIGGQLVPTGNILVNYSGACNVSGIYTSVNGGGYEYLNLSAYNFTSGSTIELVFPYQNAAYQIYYVLSNGSSSPVISFYNNGCDSGEMICGCDGTQLPIEALSWLGDGVLDDGSYFWNENPIYPVNFDCAMWGFDCDDEAEEGYFGYDPYGVCSGNLPPANGCIPEFCTLVSVDLFTDCYPEEVSISIFNANGDLVLHIPEGTFTLEYYLYELEMCLPDGCYTLKIDDSAGDGMNYSGCEMMGQFGVYNYADNAYIFTHYGNVYTYTYSQQFCIGNQTTCSNLSMAIDNNPCYSTQGGLTPSINLLFDYNGDCIVQTIFISTSGGSFEQINVSNQTLHSGDELNLYELQPNTSYIIYYTTSDGSASPLYTFTTTNCLNEVMICDCSGNQHSIGVLAWLGDGFADNGFYTWAGTPVNFNCVTWGYDCGDITGAPSTDPYNVCGGQLPPNNGCSITEEILGCTDPAALNYNPLATVNNGTCIYNALVGCTDPGACNYNPSAITDNGSCEYISCAGCTDENANNYDPTATIDDGSCSYGVILGCTDENAVNYNPLATQDDGSCIMNCIWPTVSYNSYCNPNDPSGFYVDIQISSLGNGAPYTLTNTYNNQQQVMSLLGIVTMGPFPNNMQVVIQVTSNTLNCASLSSSPLSEDCANAVYGCTDENAINYNPAANVDDGSCEFDIHVMEHNGASGIVLYPNPTTDLFNLVNQGREAMHTLEIFNSMGALVYSTELHLPHNAPQTVQPGTLASGLYHLRLKSENGVTHTTLVIQH
ncbi:MAG TPA: T9SS type A sorting domain-containing protein [Flavobacteriales bacterium]